MKKMLQSKLLLVIAPLLLHTGAYAIITASSQLAPKKEVKNSNDKIVASNDDPNNNIPSGGVNYLSTEKPFSLNKDYNFIIRRPIFNTIEFNTKTTGLPQAITLNSDPQIPVENQDVYYIEKVVYSNSEKPITNEFTQNSIFSDCAMPFLNKLIESLGTTNKIIYIKELGYNIINEDGIIKFEDQLHNVKISTQGVFLDGNPLFSHIETKHLTPAITKLTPDQNDFIKKQKTDRETVINELPKLEALNTIERLKSDNLTSAKLNNDDAKIIKKAITDLINMGKGAELDAKFMLEFRSIELQALENMLNAANKDYAKTKGISDDQKAQFRTATSTALDILKPMKNYQQLKEQLKERIEFDSDNATKTAVIDWYINLTHDQQILIQYDYYASNDKANIFNIDPKELNNTERAALKNYISDLIGKSSNSFQKDNLQTKLDTINATDPKQRTKDQLVNTLKTYADPSAQEMMIDWLTTLTAEEKKLITEDVQVRLIVNEITNKFNDLSGKANDLREKNIKELFIIKTTFENFIIKDSDTTTQKTMLDQINGQIKNNGIQRLSSDTAQNFITNRIEVATNNLKGKFTEKIFKERYLQLLDPTSKNIYAQIFKQLSLTEQNEIISKLVIRDNNNKDKLNAKATADLKRYQEAFLPAKLKQCTTAQEAEALKAEAESLELNSKVANFIEKIKQLTASKNAQEAENLTLQHFDNVLNDIFTPKIIGENGITEQINRNTGQPEPTTSQSTNEADQAAERAMFEKNPNDPKDDLEDRIKKERNQQEAEDAAKRVDALRDAEEFYNKAMQSNP